MATFHIDIAECGYARRVNTEDGPAEQWVERFQVAASTDAGRVYYSHSGSHATEEAALAELVALVSDPETDPDAWDEGEPRYGSDAWDSEAEFNLACFEADAYDEPRPHW